MPQTIVHLPNAIDPQREDLLSPTILLVEDEEMVRNLLSAALRRRGYRVLPCGDANEGIEACRKYGAQIELLLTDVAIPGMNGFEMANRIQRMQPQIRVVFMSGQPMRELPDAVQPHPSGFLQKPFTLEALTQMLDQALESLGAACRPGSGRRSLYAPHDVRE